MEENADLRLRAEIAEERLQHCRATLERETRFKTMEAPWMQAMSQYWVAFLNEQDIHERQSESFWEHIILKNERHANFGNLVRRLESSGFPIEANVLRRVCARHGYKYE